jgi:hypothetical protein
MDTTLIGPPKDIKIEEKSSYPTLVIKITASDKNVIFK